MSEAHPRLAEIESLIQSKPVVIYMKGSPDMPMCGFSAQACEALRAAGVKKEDLAFFNVLEDEEIRALIKQYSNWPTIPQVYIKGEFIGGSDVLIELYQRGELQTLVENAKKS